LGGYLAPQAAANEVGAFTYAADEYGWVHGGGYVPIASEVEIYQTTAGGTHKARISAAAALLDANVDGIAIGSDRTVYVLSSSGFVNVYSRDANGNVPPVRRICGQLTGLINAKALAVFTP
jgi:hypothetical protein